MDEIKTLLENVLSKTSDMKQAFIDLAPNSRMNMGIIGAMIIVGVLLALFGLKLVKLFTALCGFGIGAAIGAGVVQVMHPSQMTGMIILFGCAVVMAVLAFFLHKLGIFITVFIVSMAIAVTANMPHSLLIAGIYVVVSLILAILAVISTDDRCNSICRRNECWNSSCNACGSSVCGSGKTGDRCCCCNYRHDCTVYDAVKKTWQKREEILRKNKRTGFCGVRS